jgi:hypothetical protein
MKKRENLMKTFTKKLDRIVVLPLTLDIKKYLQITSNDLPVDVKTPKYLINISGQLVSEFTITPGRTVKLRFKDVVERPNDSHRFIDGEYNLAY